MFDPRGQRLYFSSQRFDGTGAIFEVSGPFRAGLGRTSATRHRRRLAPWTSSASSWLPPSSSWGGILFALGRWYPGSGAEQVDWRPTRSPELEAELELDDVDQMLEAQNARRRASGRPEITEDDVRAKVAEDERWRDELRRRRLRD